MLCCAVFCFWVWLGDRPVRRSENQITNHKIDLNNSREHTKKGQQLINLGERARKKHYEERRKSACREGKGRERRERVFGGTVIFLRGSEMS
jgi:hypothetical protein